MDAPNGSDSVYHADACGIDDEFPELLSPEQLERHIAAVADQLNRAGYTVRKARSGDSHDLCVHTSDHAASAKVFLDADRSAAWETWCEAEEGTASVHLAARIARSLSPQA
ncbi:hypothetical protein [Salinactinospora qingdaonensis]|uniref:Uncharacterized protein n=1 Tax=Salinactinospora qingdaonensis TaxID=702744 RepID=A0ABP7FE13_9ACTN